MERVCWGSRHWNGNAHLFIFSLNIEYDDCILTKTNNQPNAGMFVTTSVLSKHLMAHKSLWKLFKKKEICCLNLCQDKYHRIYFLLSFFIYMTLGKIQPHSIHSKSVGASNSTSLNRVMENWSDSRKKTTDINKTETLHSWAPKTFLFKRNILLRGPYFLHVVVMQEVMS